tara:strand:+ start:2183 stop:2929 length:747 start_codon:yes stop_codon:yes gene_type:complete
MTKILVIGGTDCSGGAGVSADIETITKLGGYCYLCVTAVTAQKKSFYHGSTSIESSMVKAQLECIGDQHFDAVKIGMLPNSETIKVVAAYLSQISCSKVVLDPVFKSSSGGALCSKESINLLKENLFPLVHILTPNLDEAGIIADVDSYDFKNIPRIAQRCLDFGAHAVLVKGGHSKEDICKDFLLSSTEKGVILEQDRVIGGTDVRGTGCRLASAIAFYIAKGDLELNFAVNQARIYTLDYILKNIR